jgi:general secretion pathway protein D
MKLPRLAGTVVVLGMFEVLGAPAPSGAAWAQSAAVESASLERVENGVPILQVIEAIAKKTGKKFVIDPKVHGEVALVGQSPTNISYDDLFTILQVYGYTAVEYPGGYVSIIPDAKVRQLGLPLVSGKETRPDAEFVTKVFTLKNVPAMHLVPILRPMLPQVGHLAAFPCSNKLIMVDTFANVRRIEAVIAALDVGEPYKVDKCDTHASPDRPTS